MRPLGAYLCVSVQKTRTRSSARGITPEHVCVCVCVRARAPARACVPGGWGHWGRTGGEDGCDRNRHAKLGAGSCAGDKELCGSAHGSALCHLCHVSFSHWQRFCGAQSSPPPSSVFPSLVMAREAVAPNRARAQTHTHASAEKFRGAGGWGGGEQWEEM